MTRHIFFWTGGGPGDPEDGPRAAAIPPLPDPDPLPRAAVITYWWGQARFEVAAYACSVRTTPWGTGQMTWLHCKQAQTASITPDGPCQAMAALVPAHYVTGVKPGPTYSVTRGRPSDDIGLYPPNHPAPPHALPLAEVEHALAGLSEWPTAAGWRFSVTYPMFALELESGGYVGYDGHVHGSGTTRAIPVFTTEAGAARFLRLSKARARVESFDRVAAFRRFLRPIRDAGTFVLFDPVPGPDDGLYADHEYPAAVVLERFLPQVRWGWSYPVYLLGDGPGYAGFASVSAVQDGKRIELLPVFTDSDLAARAVMLTARPLSAVPVADRETFGRLIRALPAGIWGVVFDPPDPVGGGPAHTALAREKLLADVEDLEL